MNPGERGAVSDPPLAYPSLRTQLGGLSILRALPARGRRLVGPWCFFDRFGPLSFSEGSPMDVGAHPHIGLQTVSFLLEGEIVHYDSLGNEAGLRAGGVNVMTAGGAIAHAERTPDRNSGRLDGVQLWIALPESRRHGPPAFQHIEEAPRVVRPGGEARVFSGLLDGVRSPAEHHSSLVGAELEVRAGETFTLPLDPAHEHGLFILRGHLALDGRDLAADQLHYLAPGRFEAALRSSEGARALLLGGSPFGETILMWWNFVARTTEEIRDARHDWENRRRFGELAHYRGPRIAAPDLMRLAEPSPLS